MSPATFEPAELIVAPPLALAWKAYRRHWPALVAVAVIPAALCLVTIVCEWLLRTAYGATWMETGGAAAFVHLGIAGTRMIAAGFLLAGQSWLIGAALFEPRPSVHEAIVEGWRACIRCGLSILPLWFLSVVYAFVVLLAGRAAWFVYAPAGAWAACMAVTLVMSIALPPLLVATARYLLCIPVALFDSLSPFQALSVAAIHLQWRTLREQWRSYGAYAFIVVATVLAPSWLLVSSIYAAATTGDVRPDTIALGQLIAIVSCLVLVPFGVAVSVTLYFRIRPDYWAASEQNEANEPAPEQE
jgi:hypothetical protein